MVWFNQWIRYIRTLREESKYTGQERVQVRNTGGVGIHRAGASIIKTTQNYHLSLAL